MVKNILIVLITLGLAGCSNFFTKPIDVDVTPVERPNIVVPDVDSFNPRDVEWIVVTEDNVEQIIQDLKDKNIDVALFSLTDDEFKKLSLNIADIIKLIEQQRAIIAAYKEYYEAERALENPGTE